MVQDGQPHESGIRTRSLWWRRGTSRMCYMLPHLGRMFGSTKYVTRGCACCTTCAMSRSVALPHRREPFGMRKHCFSVTRRGARKFRRKPWELHRASLYYDTRDIRLFGARWHPRVLYIAHCSRNLIFIFGVTTASNPVQWCHLSGITCDVATFICGHSPSSNIVSATRT